MSETLPPEYFEDIYQKSRDPWDFATSEYEAEKYKQTMATLDRVRYASAFEIGCSIGVLTEMLARRCDRVLSVDVSRLALEQARERCSKLRNVRFELMQVPNEYPDSWFELTIVSEVGYYLSYRDLEKLAVEIRRHTLSGGQILLVHWLPQAPGYPLTGDQVHDYFLSLPEWRALAAFRGARYRIELLELEARDRRV